MQEQLVSTVEAAHRLRLAFRTLERWRMAGAGPPFVRLGRRVLYRTEDLDRWVASRVESPASGAGAAAGRR